MIQYFVGLVSGIIMGTLHGYVMHSALSSGRFSFVSNVTRHAALVIALFMLKHILDVDLVLWGVGFFSSLWYYSLIKLREKTDEIRNI